jgi:hypothetical protein
MLDDKMEELRQWLSPLEPQKRHQDVCAKRFEGTGEWFIQTTQFQQWREGVSDQDRAEQVFGCYGIPGAGKTVLW